MTAHDILDALSSKQILGLTIWGEARSEPVEGQIAVGCVVRNRLMDYARFRATEATYKAVCLAPNQFSCWIASGGEVNHDAVMAKARKLADGIPWTDNTLKQALWLADGIITGVLLDNTKGATSYYAPKAMVPEGRIPSWAKNKTAFPIGDQLFLNV